MASYYKVLSPLAAALVFSLLVAGCRGPQDAVIPVNSVTVTLTANPTSSSAGAPVTLTVSSTNAATVTIDNGVGSAPLNGTVTVSPSATTTYTATAVGSDGTTAASAATVTITNTALTAQLTAAPATITAGTSSTLTWTTTGATTVFIDNGVGTVAASGSTTVSPASTITYTLTATDATNHSVTSTAQVTVVPAGSAILNLTVSPTTITSGQVATLSWTSSNINFIRIDTGSGAFGGRNGIGTFTQPNGSVTVSPSAATTFTAVGYGPDGATEIARATATLAATQDTTKLKQNVQHIIFMLQENRSFDAHFGQMNAFRAALGLSQDVDGLPAGTVQFADNGTAVNSYHFRTACVENITPDWIESHGNYSLATPASERPTMDGFIHNGSGMAKSSGKTGDDVVGGSGTTTVAPQKTTVYYLFKTTPIPTGTFPSTDPPIAYVTVTVVPPPPEATLPAQASTNFTPDPSASFTAMSTNSTGTTGPARDITINRGDSVTLTWSAPNVGPTDKTYVNTWYDQAGRRSMGYYDGNDLPYHYFMASQFAMSDRFFSPMPGNSPPNRAYGYAATTAGHAHDPKNVAPNDTGSSVKTIFELLEAAGKTWKIYYTAINDATDPEEGVPGHPHTSFTRFQPFAGAHMGHLVPIDQYYTDLQNNTLPDVAFIEEKPGYDEHPGAQTLNTIHSGNHVQRGANFVSGIINALMQSSSWSSSVFILTYDEFGGLYDHVVPPDAVKPDGYAPMDLEPKDAPTQRTDCTACIAQGFNRTGWRIPMYIVSPFVKKNYVSHTTADFTAVLKFIETRHDLPNLTERDKWQIDMLEFFDFDGKPWLTPPAPPAQPTSMTCDRSLLN